VTRASKLAPHRIGLLRAGLSAGKSVREAAREAGISHTTAQRWMARISAMQPAGTSSAPAEPAEPRMCLVDAELLGELLDWAEGVNAWLEELEATEARGTLCPSCPAHRAVSS
jgi:transposase